MILTSCSPTKYLADDESLLTGYKLKLEDMRDYYPEVDSLINPKPNRKIFGIRFPLRLYNLAGEGDGRFNDWVRKIGEPPVLYNKEEIIRNTQGISRHLEEKGYYRVKVTDTLRQKNNKVRVTYKVDEIESYKIRRIIYKFDNPYLAPHITLDPIDMDPGEHVDYSAMDDEKARLEYQLEKLGYYVYNEEGIKYQVDSTEDEGFGDLIFRILEYDLISLEGLNLLSPGNKFTIKDVQVYPNYYPRRADADFSGYMESLLRTEYNNILYHSPKNYRFDMDAISDAILLKPGQTFTRKAIYQTDSLLLQLRMNHSVDMRFKELKSTNDDEYNEDHYGVPLECHIQLLSAHDYKKIHFGYGFGFNTMGFAINRSADGGTGSINFAEVGELRLGFQINLISDIRLGGRFSLRFLPGLTFGSRELLFYDGSGIARTFIVESNFLEFPLLLKYKSGRTKNRRPYLIGGVNMRYDMASRKAYMAGEAFVRLRPMDLYLELGFGIDFFRERIKFSPEIKFSAGLRDVMIHEGDPYGSSIEGLNSYLLMLCFYFE